MAGSRRSLPPVTHINTPRAARNRGGGHKLTFFGKESDRTTARSQWIPRQELEHLLAAMMPENAEALRVSMDYGARIGDVLSMRTEAARSGRWNYREEKTGKRRRVRLSDAHRRALLSFAGKVYVFEHRLDWTRHRTRQAVYKDICRAAEAFRWLGTISPHTARKVYSVEKYRAAGGNIAKVQRLLNHSDEAVTMLYALADDLSAARRRQQQRR